MRTRSRAKKGEISAPTATEKKENEASGGCVDMQVGEARSQKPEEEITKSVEEKNGKMGNETKSKKVVKDMTGKKEGKVENIRMKAICQNATKRELGEMIMKVEEMLVEREEEYRTLKREYEDYQKTVLGIFADVVKLGEIVGLNGGGEKDGMEGKGSSGRGSRSSSMGSSSCSLCSTFCRK